jgi:hypothetical protein
MTTYYIDPSGGYDANIPWEHCFKSITEMDDKIQPGDTVCFPRNGMWEELSIFPPLAKVYVKDWGKE